MCHDSPGDVSLIMKLLSNIIARKVLSEKLYKYKYKILSLKKCLPQSMSISDHHFPVPSKCKGMFSLAYNLYFDL